MPITMPEIVARLESQGYHVLVPEPGGNECTLKFSMPHYRGPAGGSSMLVAFEVAKDGESVRAYAPRVYEGEECEHKDALFQALLQVAWRSRLVQVEYDALDGEVRLAIEVPVCDGTLTARQLDAIVRTLGHTLERFDPVVRHAMEAGKVDLSLARA